MVCRAEVLLFSGRPNPKWAVTGIRLEEVRQVWSKLERTRSTASSASRLGYSGVALVCQDGSSFQAYAGKVEYSSGDVHEWRKDAGRVFERALLNTAPPDLLPMELINLD